MDYEEIMLMRENRAKKDSQAAIREHVERRNTISEETDRNAIWNKIASPNNFLLQASSPERLISCF